MQIQILLTIWIAWAAPQPLFSLKLRAVNFGRKLSHVGGKNDFFFQWKNQVLRQISWRKVKIMIFPKFVVVSISNGDNNTNFSIDISKLCFVIKKIESNLKFKLQTPHLHIDCRRSPLCVYVRGTFKARISRWSPDQENTNQITFLPRFPYIKWIAIARWNHLYCPKQHEL